MAEILDPMTAPPLRWGIFGCGRIAHTVTASIRDATGQILAAAGARDLARAQAFSEKFGIPTAYGSHEELVADPNLDVIYIATPHNSHHSDARLALEAGKNVLLEKAFTLTAAEAQDLADLAAARGLFLMEAMWTRFLPHQVELRQRIADGVLGDLVTAVADFGEHDEFDPNDRFYSKELGGGALLDRGIYPISWIISCLGLPQTIQARAELASTGVDGHVSAILGYPERQAHGLAQASIYARTPWCAWLAGTKGHVTIPDFWKPTPLHFFTPDGETETWEWPGLLGAGYEFEVAAVARSISAGETSNPVMPISETVAIMKVLDEIRHQIGLTW